MKQVTTSTVLLSICSALVFAQGSAVHPFRAYGAETLRMIEDRFTILGSTLYRDAVDLQKPNDQPAFCWGVGVQLSALNIAAALDPKQKSRLRTFADGINVYWNPIGPTPGFDVLPGPKPVDRYYDDNEWMALALTETSERLGDKRYLRTAEATLRFVLSGEDHKLGGGIYWKENGKTSKNACSNGPAAAACLAIFRQTHEISLLAHAKEIYAWCKSYLQDPTDHLFWDSVSMDGKIDKTKWSYNTALMIRSGSELYRITHDPKYAREVQEMVSSSIDHWTDPATGALKDDGRFAHLLLESWIWAKRDVPGVFNVALRNHDFPSLVSKPLEFIHTATRMNGFYGHRWDRPEQVLTTRFELIDQASAARAYDLVAAYFK